MARFNIDQLLQFGGLLGMIFRRNKKIRRINEALTQLAALDDAAVEASVLQDMLGAAITNNKHQFLLNHAQMNSLNLIFARIDSISDSLRRATHR